MVIATVEGDTMADILIRGVEPAVHERLKARAAAAGQTLQAYLHDLLRGEVDDDAIGRWYANVRDRRRSAGVAVDAAALVAEGRRDRDEAIGDASGS